MQVTPEMYGRPAKCVACHQKWFIPEKHEVSGEKETINLKDHPELLRLPGQFSRSLVENSETPNPVKRYFKTTPQPITDINLDGCFKKKTLSPAEIQEDQQEKESESNENHDFHASQLLLRETNKTPMESFEPIRLLFSYREELNNQRNTLEADAPQKKTLDSLEAALDRTHEKIMRCLQQEQHAVAKRLAIREEEIIRLNVALRVGDCSIATFLEQTDHLRRGREILVRQNYNLLAWQELKDPFMAGGIATVALESFNEDSFEIFVPEIKDSDTNIPMYVTYGDELRNKLEMRAALERRQTEWRHMVAEHDYADVAIHEGLAETEAALARNMAAIRFCQQRMEQIVLDCDNDLKALAKFKDDIYERAAKKQLPENAIEETLAAIGKAEADIVRVRSLARQALTANSPVEVPKVSTTMMLRLQGAINENIFNLDSTLLFVAATTIILGLLMFTDSAAVSTDWLAVLATCAAVGLAVFGVILDQRLRAPVVIVLWFLLLALLMIFMYQRTAMDKYLILINNDGAIAAPFVNVRAWLVVIGAAFAGAGTGFACANHRFKGIRYPVNTIVTVLLSTFLSGITVAATHTIAPRVTPLIMESDHTLDASTVQNAPDDAAGISSPLTNSAKINPNAIVPGDFLNNASETAEGEIAENAITLLMQGVVHGEGVEPLFRTNIKYPDGRSESRSLKLGDAIMGDWTAKEYNPHTKKLTISDGERMLILEAGLQVAIATEPGETS